MQFGHQQLADTPAMGNSPECPLERWVLGDGQKYTSNYSAKTPRVGDTDTTRKIGVELGHCPGVGGRLCPVST